MSDTSEERLLKSEHKYEDKDIIRNYVDLFRVSFFIASEGEDGMLDALVSTDFLSRICITCCNWNIQDDLPNLSWKGLNKAAKLSM